MSFAQSACVQHVQVLLRRAPENPYDANAIEVHSPEVRAHLEAALPLFSACRPAVAPPCRPAVFSLGHKLCFFLADRPCCQWEARRVFRRVCRYRARGHRRGMMSAVDHA